MMTKSHLRAAALALVLTTAGAETALATVATNSNGVLSFSNLSADLTYRLPPGETQFRGVNVPDGNTKTVTIVGEDDTSALTLTREWGGKSSSISLVNNSTKSWDLNALTFQVPVTLSDESIASVKIGGMTFYKSLTLAKETGKLFSLSRNKATVLLFSGSACTVDFTKAAAVEVGQTNKTYTGLTVQVVQSATLRLPSTVLSAGSLLTVESGGQVVMAGDLTAPDPAYLQNGTKTVYSGLTLSGASSSFSCRRLVESPNDGFRAQINGGTFTATEGIELHVTNGTPFNVGTATVRTPDFNTKGSVAAKLDGTLTLDTSAYTTRVGLFSAAANAGVVVTGGGTVEFAAGGTLPSLTLASAETTLLFDDVRATRVPLEVGSLVLSDGAARICVRNRMAPGSVTLMRGLTAAQFAALEQDVPEGSSLRLEGDALVYVVTSAPTLPVRAVWTGEGSPNDVTDADNWLCYNSEDELLPDVCPDASTALISLAANLNLSANGEFAEGRTFDVQGRTLTLSAATVGETDAIAVTDSSTGTSGKLAFTVAFGAFSNRNIALSGNLVFEKDGAGDYVERRTGQSVVRETVEGGRLIHATDRVYYADFGKNLADVIAAHEFANANNLPVRAADGVTYSIGKTAAVIPIQTDVDFGTAVFSINDVGIANTKDAIPTDVFQITSRQPAVPLSGVPPVATNQASLGVTLARRSLVEIVNRNHYQFIRNGANANSGDPQHEVLLVDPDGTIDPTTPVQWDYATVTSATAYPIDEEPLTVKGGIFKTTANVSTIDSSHRYSRGMLVARSNVRIEGLRRNVVGEVDPAEGKFSDPYEGFVHVRYAADVVVSNCTFCGHVVYTNSAGTSRGSYDIRIDESANVSFFDCGQTNSIHDSKFWGVFVSNYSRNLLLERCSFSRFDAHCGVYNATLLDSDIGYQGIHAIGGGTLFVSNCNVRSDNMIGLRSDYGSFWNGEFFLYDCTCEAKSAKKKALVLVSESNAGDHNFGYPCTMPRRIVIDGLTINDGTHPTPYDGPWLFADPNPNITDAASEAAQKYPYTVTSEVCVNNVTTASGLPLQISPNTWMFRNLKITEPEQIPTYYGSACKLNDATGWYTDQTYSTLAGVAPGSGMVNVITDGKETAKLSATTGVFAGDRLELGTRQTSSTGYLYVNAVDIDLSNCAIYAGGIYLNGDGTMTVNGALTIAANENESVQAAIGARYIGGTKTRDVVIAATVTSDADAVLRLKSGYATYAAASLSANKLTGDFGGFKGQAIAVRPLNNKWSANAGDAAARVRTVLVSATALGDTSYVRTDALVMQTGTILEIGPNVRQGPERGIVFEGDVNFLGTAAVGDWTLSAPCTGGAGATLEKIDAGKVTVKTPLAFPTVVIRAGELELTAASSLPDGAKVTVEKGASFRYPASLNGKIAISGEGSWRMTGGLRLFLR